MCVLSTNALLLLWNEQTSNISISICHLNVGVHFNRGIIETDCSTVLKNGDMDTQMDKIKFN